MRKHLLIHGPLSSYSSKVVALGVKALNTHLVDSVTISTYSTDVDKAHQLVASANGSPASIQVKGAKDVKNPGFANINRQINLVREGLPDTEALVIKLRTDQTVNFLRLDRILGDKTQKLMEGAILTTNCFTRLDRGYHPSDMFMVGLASSLRLYFPEGGFRETELDDVLAIRASVENQQDSFTLDQWPEARLFRRFIATKGWQVTGTRNDSFDALRRWCVIIDARQVGMRWEKFLGGNLPLVPYRFTMEPFAGGPMEEARCYRASAFGTCSERYSDMTEMLTGLMWNRITLAYRRHGNLPNTFKAIARKSRIARRVHGTLLRLRPRRT